MGLYLVARVQGDSIVDPEVIITRDTGSTVIPDSAARSYKGKKPGMRLAVWNLGAYPAQYAVGETGDTVHSLDRASVKDCA